MLQLHPFGAACRCLLRVRENQGRPGLSDAAFLRQFAVQFPHWTEKPGATDTREFCEVARLLEVASHIEVMRSYARVEEAFRLGEAVVVTTEHVPEEAMERLGEVKLFTTLLLAMNRDSFSLWCPFPTGLAGSLPAAAPEWWDRWGCLGWVLRQSREAPSRSALSSAPKVNPDSS